MDCSQRRRFSSPFCTISSRTSQIHKVCQNESPLLNANALRLSSSKALSEHKRNLETHSEKNIIERKGRHKICRSLFAKFTELPKEQSCLEMNNSYHINCKREGPMSSKSLINDATVHVKETDKCPSIIEIPVPEMSHGNSVIEYSTNFQRSLEELIAGSSFHEVDICDSLDLSALISEEFIKKFRMVICPTKIESPPLMIADAQSTKIFNFIEDDDHLQRFPDMDTRGIHRMKSEESFGLEEHSQLYSAPSGSSSQDVCIGKKRIYAPIETNIDEQMSVPGKERVMSYKPSNDGVDGHGPCPGSTLEAHDSYGGKNRMIRGYSISRRGRVSNQSYHEQAKEFEAIFSSKVRQVAEVTDCLQHKELLYRILLL